MYSRVAILQLATMLLMGFMVTVASAGTDFQGQVVSAGEGQLVITAGDDEQEQHTFVVNEDTKIMLDGQEAELEDLLRGKHASVTAEQEESQWIAKAINAYSVN